MKFLPLFYLKVSIAKIAKRLPKNDHKMIAVM